MSLLPEAVYLAQLDAMQGENMAGNGFTGFGSHSYPAPQTTGTGFTGFGSHSGATPQTTGNGLFTGAGVHAGATLEQRQRGQKKAKQASDREFYLMYLEELQRIIDMTRPVDPEAADIAQAKLNEDLKRLQEQDRFEQGMEKAFSQPSDMPPGDGIPFFEGFK